MQVRAWCNSTDRWASLIALMLTCSCQREPARAPDTQSEYETLELRYQGSVSQPLYPELAEDLGYLAPLRLNWIGNTISGPQDIQATLTGDVDFGTAFNGSIVNLIAAKAPIVSVIGSSFTDTQNWMGLYVLEDSPIRTARDFIGKKIGMNTLAAHSDFMVKEWLSRQGLTTAEIQQVMFVVIPPVNSEQVLRQKQVDGIALSNILRDRALEHGGVRALFTDYDLFGELTSASYVLTKRFIRDHPKAARKFVEGTARAIEWARQTPRDQVIARVRRIWSKTGHGDPNILQYWHPGISAVPGGLLKERDFQIWIDWLVRDGQLKRDQLSAKALYSNAYNPFAASAQPGS